MAATKTCKRLPPTSSSVLSPQDVMSQVSHTSPSVTESSCFGCSGEHLLCTRWVTVVQRLGLRRAGHSPDAADDTDHICLESIRGAPKSLHELGIETLPQLASDEKTRLLIHFNHWSIKPAHLSDCFKDTDEMDSLSIIHQNSHEYRDEAGGLITRKEGM